MGNRLTGKKTLLSGGLASISIVIVILLWGLWGCTGDDLGLFETQEPGVPAAPPSTAASGDWYELFFTVPQEQPTWTGGLDEILAADIDQAEAFIDIAAYDFDLQSVTDALLRAHGRGVDIRMVADSDNLDLDQPQDLLEAGIPLVEDGRSAIMHNKFVIIDGFITWTGSWNFTDNGAYRNNNNALRIVSEEMAANYTYEFEEMFLDREFGPSSPADTPHRRMTIDGTLIETYFAPEDGAMDRVIEVVSRASESVRFMAFSFTDDELGAAMQERDAAGALVEGIFESRMAESEYSEYPAMRDAGLNVWRDGSPAVMHHKVIIVDGSIVILGSFNFSKSADQSNDENLLIIYNREIAAQFLEEFDLVIAQAYP